ncbi:MAG: hypothetical protein ACR2LQ_10230 [Acidimicrobiales bacterium]
MENLPFIDEHRLRVAASRADVWDALLWLLRTQLAGPAARLKRLLGLTPAELRGDWSATPQPGDSLPGFEVVESVFPERLSLRGEHRFSRYALVFELDAPGATECTLAARSWASFPNLTGRAYRAVVIGTGGHRLAVSGMLRTVARRAERA